MIHDKQTKKNRKKKKEEEKPKNGGIDAASPDTTRAGTAFLAGVGRAVATTACQEVDAIGAATEAGAERDTTLSLSNNTRAGVMESGDEMIDAITAEADAEEEEEEEKEKKK